MNETGTFELVYTDPLPGGSRAPSSISRVRSLYKGYRSIRANCAVVVVFLPTGVFECELCMAVFERLLAVSRLHRLQLASLHDACMGLVVQLAGRQPGVQQA